MASRFDDPAIQAMLQGRRVIGRVPFPGTDAEVGVRLLTDRDIDLARFDAQMYLDQQCKKTRLSLVSFVNVDPESFEREHQRQVILRAFVDPDSHPERPVEFFKTPEQVRSLDSVTVRRLWELYLDWQDAINPRFNLTDKEVEQLVAALKDEQRSKVVLAHFAHDTLASLVRFLGNQLAISRNGNASTTLSS